MLSRDPDREQVHLLLQHPEPLLWLSRLAVIRVLSLSMTGARSRIVAHIHIDAKSGHICVPRTRSMSEASRVWGKIACFGVRGTIFDRGHNKFQRMCPWDATLTDIDIRAGTSWR